MISFYKFQMARSGTQMPFAIQGALLVEDKQRDWDLFGCGDRGKSDVNTFLERQLNRE